MMRTRTIIVAVAVGVAGLTATYAQTQKPSAPKTTPGQQKALKNYTNTCQPCHGPGGKSPMPTMSLVDADWKQGSSTAQIAKTIAEGIPGTAMLPNKDKFTKEEIVELAKLVRTFDPRLKPEK
jgi:mono/diheme cytochrome c family protein